MDTGANRTDPVPMVGVSVGLEAVSVDVDALGAALQPDSVLFRRSHERRARCGGVRFLMVAVPGRRRRGISGRARTVGENSLQGWSVPAVEVVRCALIPYCDSEGHVCSVLIRLLDANTSGAGCPVHTAQPLVACKPATCNLLRYTLYATLHCAQ